MFMKSLCGLVLLTAGSVWTLWGSNAVSADEPPAANPPNVLEPQFPNIVPATSLLGRPVNDLDATTYDLVLDVETGHVALVVLEIRGQSSANYLALPTSLFSIREGQIDVRKKVAKKLLRDIESLDADTLKTGFNRAWATVRYSALDAVPYWQTIKNVDTSGFDKSEYRLTRLSEILNSRVVDRAGDSIGTIADITVLPKSGQVAYTAVKPGSEGSSKLYPVPMGALIAPEKGEQAWKIELAADQVKKIGGFSPGEWPDELNRAWVEYVHVRYGNSPLGGAQRQDQ